jgi:hypothetical protein
MRTIVICAIALCAGCGNGGTPTSTDVKLMNATARATSLASNAYEVTFAVVNGATRAIDRVEDVRLSTSGVPLQNANAVGCNQWPWTLSPGGTSGVITLEVTFGMQPALAIECQDNTSVRTSLVSPPSAPAGTFEIRVEGLLTDAEPFIATATAPIL